MKRSLLIILLFILSILFVGCDKTDDNDNDNDNNYNNEEAIEINSISLSVNDHGFKVEVTVDFDSMSITNSDVLKYGIVYVKDTATKADDITLDDQDGIIESTEIVDNKISFVISNIEEVDYNNPFSVRAYLKYNDENAQEKVIYADTFEEVKLYELAKSSDTDFAKEVIAIVEDKVVSTVDVTFLLENYIVSTDSTDYEVDINKDEDNLTISIVLKDGFIFDEEVVFLVNDEEIDTNLYTLADGTITYTFLDPTPKYVPVNVTFNPNGGSWSKQQVEDINPENTFLATTFNDNGGYTFTLLDNTATTYRWFYKIFVKLDTNSNVYKIVAIDYATESISNLRIDFDYAFAIAEDYGDEEVRSLFESYVSSEDTVGKYVLFDKDVTKYTEGDLQIFIYPSDVITSNWENELFEEVELPVPYRYQYDFLGWSDGENLYTHFPRYKSDQNTDNIIYTAVWEAYTLEDFSESMASVIPSIINNDLVLPSSYSAFTITWESSNPIVLTDDGIYKKPFEEVLLTLKATLKSESKPDGETIVFNITAKGYKSLDGAIASSYIYRSYNSVTDEFFDTLDIINAAFITADAYGSLYGLNFLSNVKTYIMPKAHEQGDRVIMSIAPESQWSTIAKDPVLINKFADSIVKTINEYGFDGVDIDWETPKAGEETKFTAMMKVVYEKVKANNPNHLVTAAIAGGMWQPPQYDLINSAKYIDYINMMTYGMTNSNGQYQNALYPNTTFDNQELKAGRTLTSCSISESVDYFHNNYYIPYKKIIVGVAFYGIKQTRSYTTSWSTWANAGSVFYTSIANSYLNNSNYTVYYDSVSQVPYIVKNDGTEFISYDNPTSIKAKSDYVLSKQLGGIMYWENGCDNTGDLLFAMKTGLKK